VTEAIIGRHNVDSDELRRLLTDAGFQQVEIEPASLTARYSNPQEFLAWESQRQYETKLTLYLRDESSNI